MSFTITNNIFRNNMIISGNQNATFRNNISTQNNLPFGNGNQNSIPNSTIFGNSWPHLAANSPAINAGFYGNGDDIGALNDGIGRPTLDLSLIPPYPTIYRVTGGGTVTTSTMTVTIGTRSNN